MGAAGCDLCYRQQENGSGKVRETHSVDPISDNNFSIFTISEIAVKTTNTVPPTHLVTRAPNRADAGLERRRPPGAPLTGLARFAGRQTLSTGHLIPRGKNQHAMHAVGEEAFRPWVSGSTLRPQA